MRTKRNTTNAFKRRSSVGLRRDALSIVKGRWFIEWSDDKWVITTTSKTRILVATLDMDAARINVQNSIEQQPEKMWQGPFRARDYIEHARLVPTRNVRGMATMFAEIAQAWKLPGSFIICNISHYFPHLPKKSTKSRLILNIPIPWILWS